MKKRLPDLPSPTGPAPDPLAEAARALLTAIEAEPVPPHLTDLALSLKAVLEGRAAAGGNS